MSTDIFRKKIFTKYIHMRLETRRNAVNRKMNKFETCNTSSKKIDYKNNNKRIFHFLFRQKKSVDWSGPK